jgi:Xaa-Pro dipeptidase
MAVTNFQLQINAAEYRQRCENLGNYLRTSNLSGVVLFDRDYVVYYTGFAFIPTERPMALVMSVEGERRMFVPQMELEHAAGNAMVESVNTYPEYPGQRHPLNYLAETLSEMGVAERIGADEDGYPWLVGYRGPKLSELTGATIVPVRAFIEDQMMIKSPAELALIRESVRWGNLAHHLLQRYTMVGVTETDVSQRASDEATRAMMAAIGPIHRSLGMSGGGAGAGYRGQIGRNSQIPHALAANLTFQKGDVLVTGASADVWGYCSELERTMIVGPPNPQQERFFEHLLAIQQTAFEAIWPGARCADVDRAVRAYFEKHDLMPYWKHHTGHAIGLRYHESPFFDSGDETVLVPGMVFTVEPGLYVPNLGGFRHSDTVLVTNDGIEIMTYYPRDLASLTLPSP